jgi:hypothetical protein
LIQEKAVIVREFNKEFFIQTNKTSKKDSESDKAACEKAAEDYLEVAAANLAATSFQFITFQMAFK